MSGRRAWPKVTLTEDELVTLALVCADYYGPIAEWGYNDRQKAWAILDGVLIRAGVHPDYDSSEAMREVGLPQPEAPWARLSGAGGKP